MSDDRHRHVLARIPPDRDLAQAVPQLHPEALHALIVHRGLHDSVELIALATPEQLSAVFDSDLWRASHAGGDEQFDGARFCEWLEVLVDAGAALAAERLVQLDFALVVAGLSSCIMVADLAVFSPAVEPSGADPVSIAGRGHDLHAEIGGYLVVARRPDAWEAIVDVLRALEEHHADPFHRMMHGCRTLSNSGWELDGLDVLLSAARQQRFDLSLSRGQRRDRAGYVAPERARAFLHAARHISLTVEPPRDPSSPQSHQALQLSSAAATAEWRREQEFAFIANALVAGCSILGRPVARLEAIDAVTATCNLGRAQWPAHWAPPPEHGLTTVFQVGWTVLHRDVSMFAAARMLDFLDTMRPRDREMQFEFQALARELRAARQAGTPWRVRGRLDILAPFDLLACAALGALFDECPVMLPNVSAEAGRGLHSVDPSAFQFIADARHIAAVHTFLRTLPELLAWPD
jgi:hypothetical protein